MIGKLCLNCEYNTGDPEFPCGYMEAVEKDEIVPLPNCVDVKRYD
jgi:hypothetical protein